MCRVHFTFFFLYFFRGGKCVCECRSWRWSWSGCSHAAYGPTHTVRFALRYLWLLMFIARKYSFDSIKNWPFLIGFLGDRVPCASKANEGSWVPGSWVSEILGLVPWKTDLLAQGLSLSICICPEYIGCADSCNKYNSDIKYNIFTN